MTMTDTGVTDNKLKVVYVGCGMSTIEGAVNLDNSPSVIIGNNIVLFKVLDGLKLLNDEQKAFINVIKSRHIKYGSCMKLPFKDLSVDVVYSSHTVEHLYREDFIKFMKEADRVLRPNGVFRMAIPDLRVCIDKYSKSGDANAFCSAIHMGFWSKPTFVEKMSLLIWGDRKHKWMYDGNSMKKFIEENSNFADVTILKAGETNIIGKTGIDYRERETESVYLECRKARSGLRG